MIAVSTRKVLLVIVVRMPSKKLDFFCCRATTKPGSCNAKNHHTASGARTAAMSIDTYRMPSTRLPPGPLNTSRLAKKISHGVPMAKKLPRKLLALNSRVRS